MASIRGKARAFSPFFKQQLVTDVIDALYNNQLEAISAETAEVVLANQHHWPEICTAFRYKEDVYIACPEDFRPWHKKSELHESLQPQMDALILEKKELTMSRLRVHALFSRAVNICENVLDLYVILPEYTHSYIDKALPVVPRADIKAQVTLTTRDLMMFRKQNEPHYDHANERFMVKMLMEKI